MNRSRVLSLLLSLVLLRGGWATQPVDESTAPPDEDWSTAPADECPAPIAENGTFAWMADWGHAGAWALTCNAGHRADPRIGSLFFCSDLEGNESTTPACEVDPGCVGADAAPSGSNAIGTTCFSVIGEGGTCEAVCEGGALPIGSFVCSSGQMLHMSYCPGAGDVVTNETVEKVAATMSMEMDREPTAAFLQSGIAAALNVSEPNVHGVQWISARRLQRIFLGSNGRRLDTKYTVSYEVIVPESSSAAAIVLVASRLAMDGTSENQALKESLRDNGINVGAMHQLIAPRSFSEVIAISANGVVAMPRTSPDASEGEDSSNVVGIVIGCIVGSFVALFVVGLLCYCAYSVRQRKSGQAAP